MGKLISPNSLFEAGVDKMLKGVDPSTPSDWKALLHFWAFNLEATSLPGSLQMMCIAFRVPVDNEEVDKIGAYYRAIAIKRQEEMLMKLIGKPVQHGHLKHLRSILGQNLHYDQLVELFKKSGLEPSWPHIHDYEKLGKLCKALFAMKQTGGVLDAQKAMIQIIEGASK